MRNKEDPELFWAADEEGNDIWVEFLEADWYVDDGSDKKATEELLRTLPPHAELVQVTFTPITWVN